MFRAPLLWICPGPSPGALFLRGMSDQSTNKEETMEWTLEGGSAAWSGIGKWTELAACRGAPIEWFVGNPSPPPETYEICAGCAVRAGCAAYGEEEHGAWGEAAVYGGILFYRRPESGRLRIYECGAYQGRRRHERRGEEVCSLCQGKTRKKRGRGHRSSPRLRYVARRVRRGPPPPEARGGVR